MRRVLHQWWLIALCALVAAVVGFAASSSRADRYEATTTIQLNEVDLASVFLGQTLQQAGQDVQSRTATNARLITFPRVTEEASKALGGSPTPSEIEDAVSATPEPDTTLIEISATDSSPERAQRVADAVRDAFIEIRRTASVAQFTDASRSLEAQLRQLSAAQRASSTGQIIRDRIAQVETLRSASNGGVETVQPAARPTAPVAPRPARDAILALILGALLGTAAALVRARLDDRIRDVDELSEHWELPVLGVVPQVDELKDTGSHLASGAALEAFALARTNLRYLHVGADLKSVVVTSAIAAEGKSTVAWNLAVAASLAGSRVLIVDGDLRRPVVAQRAGVTSRQGFSEVLAGLASPSEVIVRQTVATSSGDIEIGVVTAGMIPPSPISLLERAQTGELLREFGENYDLVLIDTPPATVVADAKVILEHVDGVVVVSRLGRVTRGALDRLREMLDGLSTPVVGTIVNSGSGAKSYGYEGYESIQDPKPVPVAPRDKVGTAS